jgi:t-SNARE complex subunit (syntaxin)
MTEPIFWLGFSLCLVSISLTAVLITLIPVTQELSRAARSAEKLFDTLNREFPNTLEAIKSTNIELTQLSGEMKEGVKSASGAVKQIDHSLVTAKKQVENAQLKSRSFWTGLKAGIRTWQTYNN